MLAALILLSNSLLIAQTGKPTLAVLDFEGFGISKPEVATLTNRFRANLAQLGQFTLIERSVMEEILLEQEFSLTGCITDECAVKVGQLLGVRFMLAGSIGRVGSTWTVELRIIDVESGAIERTAVYDIQGAIDLMLTEGMAEAARRIVNVEAATSAKATPITIETVHKITAPDGRANDYFGHSVALSGDHTIIGSWGDSTMGDHAGAAYIFRHTGANYWDGGTKLFAPDAKADEMFGKSVALSGDYAIVGAWGDNTKGRNTGAAYVFLRTGINSWENGTKLIAADGKAYAMFGQSVALSDNFAIVGANGDDSRGDAAGAAYVFRRTGPNDWDGGTKLFAPDGQADDWFGGSVALNGDYVIVGARGEDSRGKYAGAAYVFRRTGANDWDDVVKFLAPDGQADNFFGKAVALSGNFAIVGAWGESSRGDYAGAAYVFRRTGANDWDGGTKLLAPDAQAGDSFGGSVVLSNEYAIVGASGEDSIDDNTGAVYLFRRTGVNSWDGGIKFLFPDAKAGDLLGGPIGVSDDYAVVGVNGETLSGSKARSVYLLLIK